MMDLEAPKHLNPGQLEALVQDRTVLHLMGCAACSEIVNRNAQEQRITPLPPLEPTPPSDGRSPDVISMYM